MSRHWAIGLVAIGLLFSWSTVAAAPKSPSADADAPYRFVGYSSDAPADLVFGSVGLPTFYARCQDPVTGFGPDARMCTTEEFFRSPNIEVPTPVINAWIHPVFVGAAGSPLTALEFSGRTTTGHDFSCAGWTAGAGGSNGLTVQDNGGFSTQTCGVARQVTCCAPAQ